MESRSERAHPLPVVMAAPAWTADLRSVRGPKAHEASWRSGGRPGITSTQLEATVSVKPAEKTETTKAHRVPLSRQALELLAPARWARHSALVFPRSCLGPMLGNSVMTQAMCAAGLAGSGHGIRPVFQ